METFLSTSWMIFVPRKIHTWETKELGNFSSMVETQIFEGPAEPGMETPGLSKSGKEIFMHARSDLLEVWVYKRKIEPQVGIG